ncbi:MAG: ATP-binding protein [Bryobacteraceae bacterium]
MMTNQTLGQYREDLGERREFLTLAFSPLNAPLQSRWRNNGLSADFLGEYVVTFLPSTGVVAEAWQKEIRHSVTYIANELLENSMKFHERNVDIPIRIHLELTRDHIMVSSSNGVNLEQAERYRSFVGHIVEEDPGELLVKQLEANGADHNSNTSALGLLTIISDYHGEVGWQFEVDKANPEILTVTTRVVLPLKNLTGEQA